MISTKNTPHPLPHFLITRMRVDRRRQRAHMPRKPLRQEKVPACPIHVCDRGVPQGVEGVEPVKSGPHLPGPESELDSPFGDTDTGLGTE